MNYYEVLEVNLDASIDDINKSYKRLALKYHPDKYKLDEGERFKKINEAYQILKDPQQRMLYDALCKDDSFQKKGFQNIGFENIQSFFQMILSLILKFSQKKPETSNVIPIKHNISLNINVDLESIYYGEIKKLVIYTKRLSGEKIKKNIYIPLKVFQDIYNFQEEGDEYDIDTFGDIAIHVDVNQPVNIKRDKIISEYDLHVYETISLYEYYTGIDRIVHVFKEQIHVKKEPDTNKRIDDIGHFICHVEKNKGLHYKEDKRGDLYIYFRLTLPSTLDSKSIDIIKTIFT